MEPTIVVTLLWSAQLWRGDEWHNPIWFPGAFFSQKLEEDSAQFSKKNSALGVELRREGSRERSIKKFSFLTDPSFNKN